MDIQQARHILNAAEEGADISEAIISEALRATGDLAPTSVRPTPYLPSQDLRPEYLGVSLWPVRIAAVEDAGQPCGISARAAAVKAILATPHGPTGTRRMQRGKAFE